MDLPHCPQVFWQRPVTYEFVPQYLAYKSHLLDISSHAPCVIALFVVDGISVVASFEKEFMSDIGSFRALKNFGDYKL